MRLPGLNLSSPAEVLRIESQVTSPVTSTRCRSCPCRPMQHIRSHSYCYESDYILKQPTNCGYFNQIKDVINCSILVHCTQYVRSTDFLALATETNARKRMRFLALAHFQEGHSRTDIATAFKVSRTSVNKWVSNFLLHGVAGLDSVRPPGRPAKLGRTAIPA